MDAGQEVGPYRLVERIGKGGFAEVWQAQPEPERWLGDLPLSAARLRSERLESLARLLEGWAAPVEQTVRGLAETWRALEAAGGVEPERAALREALVEPTERALAWAAERCRSEGRDVALKVPYHDGYVRQLRRETDVLHRVEHAGLVRQLHLDVTHDPPFLAMERIQGWCLRDALKQEAQPPLKKVLAVMDQLLAALHYLHRRGLVHGDVKPENVLLDQQGHLTLIDLGLGRVSQAVMRDTYLSLSLASRVPLQGTLSYMAPEVRKGQPPGPAADLYSAGILLYELLVGDVPAGLAAPSEAAPQRGLTSRFDVLLKWVLHPDPDRRVPSAQELRERVLLTLQPRERHRLGQARSKKRGREGTQSFDAWALEQASPFVQGDWVGHYQLGEPLGRGGFGEVWQARAAPDSARDAGGQVALKLALGSGGPDALQREAEVARRLDHALIPKVLGEHLDHDPPFLAVQFVRGRSLRARLVEDGPLEPGAAAAMIRSLVGALAHCHTRGVVHQDLKPENLLLDEQKEELYLLDFGLASAPELSAAKRAEVSKQLQSQAQEGGTFEYMAPERRRGEPGGPAADTYALGVILFEMLTGELPQGLTKLRELCPLASPGLEALAAELLHRDPLARPSLGQVANRLEKSQPRTRRRAPTRRTARQDGLSSLQLAGLAGVAIVLLGAGLGWGGGSRASAERAGSPREAARQPLALPDLDLSPFELERQALELRTDPGHPKRRRAAQRLQALVRQRRAARTLAEEALQLRSRLPEVAESELDPAAAQARRERLRTVADELERAARLDPRDPQSSSWWRQAREAAEEARALAARVPLEAAADPESQAAEAARRFREQALLARLLTGQPATEEELRASSSAAAARRLRWLEQRRLAELSEESERLSEARRLLWSEPDRPELAAGELAACSGEARLLRLCSRAVRGLPVPQQADARLQGRLQAVRGGTVALGEAQRRLSRHAHQVRRDERYATTLQSHAERVTRLAQQRELAIWRLLLAIEADAGVGGP